MFGWCDQILALGNYPVEKVREHSVPGVIIDEELKPVALFSQSQIDSI